MRKPLAAGSGIIVLVATGFAVASIVAGGSLAAIAHALTGTTETQTVTTATTDTTTAPNGRRVEICHWTHSKKHPYHTIVVDQHAVRAHLRHGDDLGRCTRSDVRRHRRHHEHGASNHEGSRPNATPPTTTAGSFTGTGTTTGHGNEGGNQSGNDDSTQVNSTQISSIQGSPTQGNSTRGDSGHGNSGHRHGKSGSHDD